MEKELIAKKTIGIQASASKVWEALTNPELIKKYFFGTEAISDWKVGSSLTFRGVWEGKTYEDKGTILDLEPNRLLKYNYWSSMSGKEDVPENYANITYILSEENGTTNLSIIQDKVPTEESKEHSENNWGMVLNSLKELLENQKMTVEG